MKTTHRTPAEIKADIKEVLNDFKNLENFDKSTYKELKKELDEAEEAIKQNSMFLFIEAQNIVNKHMIKTAPEAQKRIKNILGEKFLNMDNSRNYKYINLFEDLETIEVKKLKNYNYRLTTKTRANHNAFILDVKIHIWKDSIKHDYETSQYLAYFENGTSFKELQEFTPEYYETYNYKTEYKKLIKYQEQRAKLEEMQKNLNSEFATRFLYDFRRDQF